MTAARTYVHAARAVLDAGGDPAALGAAVTVGLCGSWEHDGPCLWPHHSATGSEDGATTVRTVFRADPAHEPEVRRLIDGALRTAGRSGLTGPDGTSTGWAVEESGPADPSPDENALGERLGGLPDSSP